MTSSHVRSSQCPEIHGLDLHTAEEPLGRGVVGAAPLRAHGPDQAVPAHPFQPSRPPVMTTAVTVDHGTLAGPQRGGGPDPASCRAGSAFGDVPVVCATTMPSWQSIIGERYTFPSPALIPRGVREPLLIGSFGGEIPVDEVVRRGRDLALVRAVASPSGNTGDQPVLAHDPADHLLRDTRPERGLDPPLPVPAPGIGERPRHAGAQPGVLADAEPRVVAVRGCWAVLRQVRACRLSVGKFTR